MSSLRALFNYATTVRNWDQMVRGHLTGRWPSEIRLRDGIRITFLNTREEIWAFRSIYWTRCYERDFTIAPEQNSVVLDMGANVGIFTLYAASRLVPVGKVYAFEPNPRCYPILLKNIADNSRTNIIASAAAVSDSDGSSTLFDNGESLGASMFEEAGEPYAIRTESLPTVLAATGPVALLKANIEGAEYGLLLNSPAECWKIIDRVAIKYHEGGPAKGRHSSELSSRLTSLGYRILRHEKIWNAPWGQTGIICAEH